MKFALACGALLMLFALLCWSAVRTKSATYDEPYHALAAWIKTQAHDQRMDYEDPPLTQDWAALGAGPLHVDLSSPAFQRILADPMSAWDFMRTTLYQTPANDSLGLITHERLMSIAWGVALGLVITIWTWRLAGKWAALLACLFFSLDPNFLAHAGLIKDDVAAALMLAGTFFALWRAGERMTPFRAIAVALWAACAMNVKFSAILIWPMIGLLIVVRAIMPQAWPVLGKNLARTYQKLLAGLALLIVATAMTIAVTWACYGFRFSVSTDPAIRIDPQVYLMELRLRQFQSHHPLESYHPTPPQYQQHIESAQAALQSTAIDPDTRQRLSQYIDQARAIPSAAEAPQLDRLLDFVIDCTAHPQATSDPFARIARLMLDHHLMPEAWTSGLMFHYAHATLRRNFLLGRISEQGWWYYFPLAMLFKTPLATLIALVIAGIVALRNRAKWNSRIWPIACLTVPPIVFLIAAMSSHVNLGLRHILPVYPFIFVAIGSLLTRFPKPKLAPALTVLLACETLLAWPNYIDYFNWACGGWYGGIHLLGDSNLDWGQDLPALANWQHENGDAPIALAYFGSADPTAYGVHADALPVWPPTPELLATHVLAISATGLQGIYIDGYVPYAQFTPAEVLGGTIYLYDLRPRK